MDYLDRYVLCSKKANNRNYSLTRPPPTQKQKTGTIVLKQWGGTFPAFPAHAQPAILRIW